MNTEVTSEKIKEICTTLFSDKSLGNIFRVKGFLKENEKWLELNATEKQFELKPIKNGQDIIIAIGENLNEEKIKEIFNNAN